MVDKSQDNSPLKKEISDLSAEKCNNDPSQSGFAEQVPQNSLMRGLSGNNSNDFVCITCHRGPPYTRKYAKNQCQTCYKKTKKYQKDSEDFYGGYPGLSSPMHGQGFQQPYPPSQYESQSNGHYYRQYSKGPMQGGYNGMDNSSMSMGVTDEQELHQELAE